MKRLELRTVFAILSVAGLAATAFFASKDGEKLKTMKDNAAKENKPLDKKEVAKNYIRTGVAAAATTFCIVKSHKLSTTEIAAITATATYLTANRDYLEKKLKEHVSEEKLKEIKDGFFKSEITNKESKSKYTVEETGYGETLFIDAYSGRMFRSSLEAVNEALCHIKAAYEGFDGVGRNPVSYNDLFDAYGICRSAWGDIYGWGINELFDNEITWKVDMISKDEVVKPGEYASINEDYYLISLYPYQYPRDYWEA